ncbi:hypothetical protein QTP86_019382 [Hemibagrus guttatus]|nr:hypothetical protein QTP86_019382 [Hemibagrus guttatus]
MLQGEEVKKVQEFNYLGSTVQSNAECGKEVKKRVQAGWNGWRKTLSVLDVARLDISLGPALRGRVIPVFSERPGPGRGRTGRGRSPCGPRSGRPPRAPELPLHQT